MSCTNMKLAAICNILYLDICELWLEIDGQFFCIAVQVSSNLFLIKGTEIENGGVITTTILGNKYLNKQLELIRNASTNLSWEILQVTDVCTTDNNLLTEFGFVLPFVADTENIIMIPELTSKEANIYLLGGSNKPIPYNSVIGRYLNSVKNSLFITIFEFDKLHLRYINKNPPSLEPECKNNENFSQSQLETNNKILNCLCLEQENLLISNSRNSSIPVNNKSLPINENFNIKISKMKSVVNNIHLLPSSCTTSSFLIKIETTPIINKCPKNLHFHEIVNPIQIAEGSNSIIYIGNYRHQRVIIKMIKISATYNKSITREFDIELNVLCRLHHPNIIRILGAGRIPRRFIILEYLAGGTLDLLLRKQDCNNTIKNSFQLSQLFRSKKSKLELPFLKILSYACDLASVFVYLHTQCISGAMVIHRDLKPDNIGFTDKGVLKLFDFGLCTCVKKRDSYDEKYKMTGRTGSLRYMAPEVFLNESYTESTDVYSFAILIWQMASMRIPFEDISNIEELTLRVAIHGERPLLDTNWPPAFNSLLIACWQLNPLTRPVFNDILSDLETLRHQIQSEGNTRRILPFSLPRSLSWTTIRETLNLPYRLR